MKALAANASVTTMSSTFIGLDINAAACQWIYEFVSILTNRLTGEAFVAACAFFPNLVAFIFSKIAEFVGEIAGVIGGIGGPMGAFIAIIVAIVGALIAIILANGAAAGENNKGFRIGWYVTWGVCFQWVDDMY